MYCDGREWKNNDVYIKYKEQMPIGLCFYMENIFTTDGNRCNNHFYVCLVFTQ